MNIEIVDDTVRIVEIDVALQPVLIGLGTLADPHTFIGGPASGATPGPAAFRLLVPDDMPFAAILDRDNVLTGVNFTAGLRVGVRLVTADYVMLPTDFVVTVDATAGPVNITLPPAIGSGQHYRVKRVDTSGNIVTVTPQEGETIDGSDGVVLGQQYQVVTLVDDFVGLWDSGTSLPADIARLNQDNFFTKLNVFKGVRFTARTVTTDYDLNELDFEVLVDASAGPVTLMLPPSMGNCQYYRIKKIDTSDNIVTIAATDGDFIDGAISVNLHERWHECSVFAAAANYWDNMGARGGDDAVDTGGNIAFTTNLLMGDGAGNAISSGINPADVVLRQPEFSTPTNSLEIVACLRAAGLCA